MKKYYFPLIAVALLITGCLLSGTFVVTQMFHINDDLVHSGNEYYLNVDISDEGDWKDHKDKLKYVDAVGFELWATNGTDDTDTLTFWVAPDTSGTTLNGASSESEVMAEAKRVLKLPLPKTSGSVPYFLGYASSLKYLENVKYLAKRAFNAEFQAWGYTTNTNVDLHIDSIKVVVTFTAGA